MGLACIALLGCRKKRDCDKEDRDCKKRGIAACLLTKWAAGGAKKVTLRLLVAGCFGWMLVPNKKSPVRSGIKAMATDLDFVSLSRNNRSLPQ